MNIPLDNLYHWLRSCADEPVSIYTFKPHGSKNISNLSYFEPIDSSAITPELVCHDQEPLNYSLYQDINATDIWQNFKNNNPNFLASNDEIHALAAYCQHLDFLAMITLIKSRNIYDRYILLHSETNSKDVEKFSCNAETVYYWCHAVIARDWYRFAETDPRLNQLVEKKQTFLVYCRAWTGTREYRLKFLDLMLQHSLIDNCKISILHQDQQIQLSSYVCCDPKLQPTNMLALFGIANNTYLSDASADYSANDIVSTDISVVLETVAADTKIHLTEKTLRPIACGHPFMLVAGPGSIAYLKSYGFETFSPWIDESYDAETDVVKRMQIIAKEMQRIENLGLDQKIQMMQQIKKIAERNKIHFFSKEFFDQVQSELIANLNTAIRRTKHTRGHRYLARRALVKKYDPVLQDPTVVNNKRTIVQVLRQLRKDPTVSLRQIIDQYPPGYFNV